jgi:hypothetical protein
MQEVLNEVAAGGASESSDFSLRAKAVSVMNIGAKPLGHLKRISSGAFNVVKAMEDGSVSAGPTVGAPAWRLLLMVLLAMESIAVPYRAAFDQQGLGNFSLVYGGWWLLDIAVNLLLFWEALASVSSVFATPAGLLRAALSCFSGVKLSRVRLQGRFLLKLVLAFPFEHVLAALIRDHITPNALRWVMLTRLTRIGVIYGILAQWSSHPHLPFTWVALASFAFSLVMVVHLSTCFWFFLCVLDDHNSLAWTSRYGYAPNESSVAAQYTAALYWATQTLFSVGYGDIVAVLRSELAVSIVVSLLGSFLFSFIIGYIQLMQEHLFSSGNVYTEKVALTLDYCKRHGIPQSLLYRISHFFDYCYRVRPFVGEAEILSAMSPSLRAAVVLVMNDAVLARVPLFAALGEEFQVGPKLRGCKAHSPPHPMPE